jgi:hypothetical protein
MGKKKRGSGFGNKKETRKNTHGTVGLKVVLIS